jgi:hypothetical protein
MADDPNASSNGWNEWSKHVLKELERLTDSSEALRDLVLDIQKNAVTRFELQAIKDEMRANEIETLKEIADIKNKYETKIIKIEQELKFKAGIWGSIAGMIPVFITVVLFLIKNLT